MKQLNDELLIKTYYKALELNLQKDFILILEEELDNRKIEIVQGKMDSR